MSNEETTVTTEATINSLKARADLLGVQYHPSIGEDKLREKINAKMQESEIPTEEIVSHVAPKSEGELINMRRRALINDAKALVRIRLTCMNPAKKDWDGEIFTIGNSIVGSLKQYVPFNNEGAWHVSKMLYTHLKEKQCQIFVTARNAAGVEIKKSKLIKEFSIEELPQLTAEELKDLAIQQAMSKSVGD